MQFIKNIRDNYKKQKEFLPVLTALETSLKKYKVKHTVPHLQGDSVNFELEDYPVSVYLSENLDPTELVTWVATVAMAFLHQEKRTIFKHRIRAGRPSCLTSILGRLGDGVIRYRNSIFSLTYSKEDKAAFLMDTIYFFYEDQSFYFNTLEDYNTFLKRFYAQEIV